MRNVIGILVLCTGIGNAQETVNGGPVVMGTLKATGAPSAADFTGVWSLGRGGAGGGLTAGQLTVQVCGVTLQ